MMWKLLARASFCHGPPQVIVHYYTHTPSSVAGQSVQYK